ncbi:hypothetical protein F8C76_03840 [Flagellimonas olearia]|uniref:IPT/TIG domain-containing protein n=1 Tax=Flagellimonas olearia TaxID=552546 RepID=A0A6I1E403_9FLAO|nr:IPT/TIG domain-containing protein [Allomuricauda olearia]KAB7530640.1 hypothetical protein F8C76_03840 [Allomuricauda olearia]
MKKAILMGLPIMSICLILSCGKDDGPTPDPEPQEVEIASFSPTSGTVGTEVTINGKNFSSTKEENNVTFGSFKAPVVEASPTKLVVQVPTNAVTGKITVTVGSSSATSATNFEVLIFPGSLSIDDFQPKEGDFGTIVFIDGSNFSAVLSENTVKFGDVQAEVTDATTSKLTVKVPSGANTNLISVTVADHTTETAEYFQLPVWRTLNDFSGSPRRNAFSCVVDGNAYVGMGIGDGNFYDIWSYDQNGDSWSNTESAYPGKGNTDPAEFVLDGKVYVLDGLEGGLGLWTNEFRSYDVATNEWTNLPNFSGSVRYRAIDFTLQGKGYVVGGISSENTFMADVWEYDSQEGTWTEKTPYPQPEGIYNMASFIIDDHAYVGAGGVGPLSSSADFYKFDGVDWTPIASLPESAHSRVGPVGFSINGKGYIGLGRNVENYLMLQDFYEYDPGTDVWTQIEDFPSVPRYLATAFVLDGKAYVGLGDAGGDLDEQQDIYLFDPANIAPQ